MYEVPEVLVKVRRGRKSTGLSPGQLSMFKKQTAGFEKSKDRKYHKRYVRAIFVEMFDIHQDKDIVNHIPAPENAVRAFFNGEGRGPNLTEPHFTLVSPGENAWNRHIARYMAAVLGGQQVREQWRRTDPKDDGELVATASHAYWEQTIMEKFLRCRVEWVAIQPRWTTDPYTNVLRLETREETHDRTGADATMSLAIARRKERRSEVSVGAWHTVTTLTSLCSVLKGEFDCVKTVFGWRNRKPRGITGCGY
jgi:hypothetical protein